MYERVQGLDFSLDKSKQSADFAPRVRRWCYIFLLIVVLVVPSYYSWTFDEHTDIQYIAGLFIIWNNGENWVPQFGYFLFTPFAVIAIIAFIFGQISLKNGRRARNEESRVIQKKAKSFAMWSLILWMS